MQEFIVGDLCRLIYKRLIISGAIAAIAATCAREADSPTTVPPPNQVTPTRLATAVVSAPTFTRAATSKPLPPATSAPTRAAASPTPARNAIIVEVENKVQSRASSNAQWKNAEVNQTLPVGGEVQTVEESNARIDVSPDTVVRIGENSHFVVTALSGTNNKPTTTLSVIVGEIWVMLNSALNGGSFDVETPVGVAAVRGSSVGVDYDLVSDSVIVSCLEGDCSLRNQAGAVNLQAEQETHIARRNQAPSAARAMDPARLERWRKYVKESDRFISAAATRLARTWTAPGYDATRRALQTQVPRSLTKVSGFETRVGTLPALPTNILTRIPPNQQTLVATALTARAADNTPIRLPSLTPRP